MLTEKIESNHCKMKKVKSNFIETTKSKRSLSENRVGYKNIKK